MEGSILSLPEIHERLERMVRVVLYTDRDVSPYLENRGYKDREFGVPTNPFYAVLCADGKVMATMGYDRNAEAFAEFLDRGLKGCPEVSARDQ